MCARHNDLYIFSGGKCWFTQGQYDRYDPYATLEIKKKIKHVRSDGMAW